MLFNIPAADARRILADAARPLGTETVPLYEAAGRVLGRGETAARSVPPFDRSPYDGYALRGADTALAARDNPAVLKITQEIPAGHAPERPVGPGECAKILTGAPIPPGADAVVKYELTEFTDTEVGIFAPVPPGADIVPEGEDVKSGDVLARRGDAISPELLGVFAAQGLDRLEVFKRPRAALLCTGSELLQPGEEPRDYKIFNSNTAAVGARLEKLGLAVTDAGTAEDEPGGIARRLAALLGSHDLAVTTGGACLGDYDFAASAFDRLGARILFHKVDMKPGGAFLAAVKDGKLIIALSGNPGAAIVGLAMVAAPAIRRLCGLREVFPEPVTLILKRRYKKPSPRRRFVRGYLEIDAGRAYFVPGEGQGNGMLSSFLNCGLLAEIPEGSPPLEAGALITAHWL